MILCAAGCCAFFFSHNKGVALHQSHEYVRDQLELKSYSQEEIIPLLPLIQEWAARDFLNYPYLWVAPEEEVFSGFSLYINEQSGMGAVVKKQGQVVGIALGLAFDCEGMQALFGDLEATHGKSLNDKVKEKGFDPSRIIYMSLFLTAPEYRNDPEIVELLYNRFVDFAHAMGRNQLCYFEDARTLETDLKPENPIPIEPWGYVIHGFRSMNIRLDLRWNTLQSDGSSKEQFHTSEFFVKDI